MQLISIRSRSLQSNSQLIGKPNRKGLGPLDPGGNGLNAGQAVSQGVSPVRLSLQPIRQQLRLPTDGGNHIKEGGPS